MAKTFIFHGFGGSWYCIPLFTWFYTSKRWLGMGFLNHQRCTILGGWFQRRMQMSPQVGVEKNQYSDHHLAWICWSLLLTLYHGKSPWNITIWGYLGICFCFFPSIKQANPRKYFHQKINPSYCWWLCYGFHSSQWGRRCWQVGHPFHWQTQEPREQESILAECNVQCCWYVT